MKGTEVQKNYRSNFLHKIRNTKNVINDDELNNERPTASISFLLVHLSTFKDCETFKPL